MKVQVNNKEVEITPDSTLTQLTAQLELPVQGIAIAVNNKMIPRTEWEGFMDTKNVSFNQVGNDQILLRIVL